MIGDDDIRKSLREVAEFLRERAEFPGYGYYRPANPHDFHPDPECTTPEENERHRQACEAYDKGNPIQADPEPFTVHATHEAATAYLANAIKCGAASGQVGPRDDGTFYVHCHVGGWGMGSYVDYDHEMLAMAKRLDEIADELPGDEP